MWSKGWREELERNGREDTRKGGRMRRRKCIGTLLSNERKREDSELVKKGQVKGGERAR